LKVISIDVGECPLDLCDRGSGLSWSSDPCAHLDDCDTSADPVLLDLRVDFDERMSLRVLPCCLMSLNARRLEGIDDGVCGLKSRIPDPQI